MRRIAALSLVALASQVASADVSAPGPPNRATVTLNGVRFSLNARPQPWPLGWDLALELTAESVDRPHRVALRPMSVTILGMPSSIACGFFEPLSQIVRPGAPAHFDKTVSLALAGGSLGVEVMVAVPDGDCQAPLAIATLDVSEHGTPSVRVRLAPQPSK